MNCSSVTVWSVPHAGVPRTSILRILEFSVFRFADCIPSSLSEAEETFMLESRGTFCGRGLPHASTPRSELETGPLQRENSCQERNAFSRIEFVCQSFLQPESSNPSTCSSATFSPALIQGNLVCMLLVHKAQFAQPDLLHCGNRFFGVHSWHCMFNFLHCTAS